MSLSGKYTLLKRWLGIILGKNRVAINQGSGTAYSLNTVAGYYNDLTGKVNEKTLLDENGVVINLIEGGKLVYFPISICQYALGQYDLYLSSGDIEHFKAFLIECEWLNKHQREDGSWDCFGPIGYSKYTVSSMCQGEATSAFLRAYVSTGDEKWLNAAEKAVQFMIIPIENGGTLSRENGLTIFEEYPDLEGTKKSVLNGWIFTLFGLYDYLKIVDSKEISSIFSSSVDSLKRILTKYDMKYWSRYDLSGRVASPAYHRLHISLLYVMAEITHDEYFSNIADIWSSYSNSKVKKFRAIVIKAFQKVNESSEGTIVQ